MDPAAGRARLVAVAALLLALGALIVVLVSAGSTYVLHARFADAGQLVSGDLVTVGGHQVGSVGKITLTGNGLADVELDITDSSLTPLRASTIARVGQLSLTGVANRFVALEPGMGGATIPSGGALPSTQTRGIVDLDTLLDSLTPPVRASLDRLLASGANLVAQPTASQLNRAAAYFNPFASQGAQLGNEVVADKAALSQLVSAIAALTTALAERSGALGGAVTNTAATLREVASERSALEDSLARAPGVLAQATRVLGHVKGTLGVLDPALARLPPVARRLAVLLPELLRAESEGVPTLDAVRRLLPGAEHALEAFPPIEALATPAVRSLTRALKLFLPDLSLLRPYGPDVVAGFFNGVGGATAGSYDANGHYLHGMIAFQGGGSSITGLPNLLAQNASKLGPFNGERTGAALAVSRWGQSTGPRRLQPLDIARRDRRRRQALQPDGRPAMRRAAATVGLLAAVGLLAVLVMSGGSRGTSAARFDVIFDNARGLVSGQVVKVAGARAGTVDNVVVTSSFKARIEASIERRFMPFHENATCTIRPEALVAENYLQCDPGTSGSPILRGSGGHPPTVPVSHTSEPVSLLDLFNIFNLPTRERLSVLLDELGIATAGRGADINQVLLRANPTLALARQAIGILSRQRADLQTVIDSGRVFTAQAAAHTGALKQFIESAAGVSALAAAHRGALGQDVQRLPGLLAVTQPALRQLDAIAVQGTPLLTELGNAVPGLRRVSRDLGPFARAARPALQKLASALRSAIPAIHQSVPLLDAIEAYARRSLGNTELSGALFPNLQRHGFIEEFLAVTYYVAASLARFDSTSHILPLLLVAPNNGMCGRYATSAVSGCSAHYGSQPAYQPQRRTGAGPARGLPDAMRARGLGASLLDNPVLIGTLTILVVALAVYLSYIAENGLPFVPTYSIAVQVANADELAKNADVRVGGARVGQILSITPEPASRTWPHPFAQLSLALDSNLGPLPPDTHYRIRLSSVLGGKYLELIPGHVRTGRIPDGGTLTLNANPGANHELPFVDLDTALGAFGPATRQALRAALDQFSEVVAGRGNQVNDALVLAGPHAGAARSAPRPAGRPPQPTVPAAERRRPDDWRARRCRAGADEPAREHGHHVRCARALAARAGDRPAGEDRERGQRRPRPRAADAQRSRRDRHRAAAGRRSLARGRQPAGSDRAGRHPDLGARAEARQRASGRPVRRGGAGPRPCIDEAVQRARLVRPGDLRSLGRRGARRGPAGGGAGSVRLQRGRPLASQFRLRAHRGRQQRGVAAGDADVRPEPRPRRRPHRLPTCTSTTTRLRTPLSARRATRATRRQAADRQPAADLEDAWTTPRRRRASWPRARRQGWCREARAHQTPPRSPRHRRRRLHPLAITALVIASAVIVTYLAFNHGLPFVHRFTLRATVANSVNVRGGDPVRIAGIDVGRVVAVSPRANDSRSSSRSTRPPCPSTATPRSGSATACSWRAATTWSSTRDGGHACDPRRRHDPALRRPRAQSSSGRSSRCSTSPTRQRADDLAGGARPGVRPGQRRRG